jgi:predicted MFS family arabinose efflux permease
VGASLVEQPGLRTIGCAIMVGSLAVGGLFVARQRHAASPLVPPAAFASRNLRTGTILSFVNTATTSSAALLVVLHLQRQLGTTALEAGLRLMPLSVSVIIGSVIAKPIGDRVSDRRLAVLGLTCIAVGNGVLAVTAGSRSGVLLAVTIVGTGLGLAAVAATTIGTTVTDRLAGSATGLLNTGGQVGTALGVAVFLTVATIMPDPVAGSVTAWTAIAVVAGLTAMATLLDCRRRMRASRHV